MSSGSEGARKLATAEDLLAIPEADRFHEVIGGEILPKASPSGEHGDAQSALAARLKIPFQRRSGGRQPGGWWILTEVEVELEPNEVPRPDLVGWRRERMPLRPTGTPIRIRPDWICEVLSRSNASTDLVKKLRIYHRCQIPHYWIVDPSDEILIVQRWTPEAYLTVLTADRSERVRAEPFDAIELEMKTLFGEEADEE